MTSKIVVNNIEADSGINTITFINEVTAPTFNGNITGTAATFTTGTFSGNVDIAGALTYEDVTNVDSVGIITARSGIHVTGGNVGIGTDNPGAKTHIDSTTSNTPLVVEASQNNRSRIVFRNNVETGTECNIELFDDDLRFVTNSGERLRIDVNGKLLQGKTETKGSTGENVPTYCTEIANTNNPNVFEIANNGTNTNNSYSALALVRSDGTSVNSHTAVDSGDKIGEVCYIGADGVDRFNTAAAIAAFANADFTANNCPANLAFYTNGGSATATERLRIQSNGRVNIGVNPNVGAQALLNLKGDNDNGNQTVLLRLGNDSSGSGTGAAICMGAGAGASSQGATIAGFYDGTGTAFTVGTNASFNGSTTERLRITSAGLVGIGTAAGSSGSTRLVVHEESGNAQTIEVKAANTGGVGSQPGIRFTAPNNDNIGAVYADVSSDSLNFSTGNFV